MRNLRILLLAVRMIVSLSAYKSDDYKEAMELYVNKEYGHTQWDIGRYRKGDLIFWDEFHHYDNGKQYNG